MPTLKKGASLDSVEGQRLLAVNRRALADKQRALAAAIAHDKAQQGRYGGQARGLLGKKATRKLVAAKPKAKQQKAWTLW